jgi:hypothetical protein
VSITVNEMTITVPGNVVKNNDKDGNTLLRFSQDQLQNIVDQAGPVLDFFKAQAGTAVGVPVSNKKLAANLDPAQEAVNGLVEANKADATPPKAPAGA